MIENRMLIDSEWDIVEGQWYDPEIKPAKKSQ